jgi:hypothetical protein
MVAVGDTSTRVCDACLAGKLSRAGVEGLGGRWWLAVMCLRGVAVRCSLIKNLN